MAYPKVGWYALRLIPRLGPLVFVVLDTLSLFWAAKGSLEELFFLCWDTFGAKGLSTVVFEEDIMIVKYWRLK